LQVKLRYLATPADDLIQTAMNSVNTYNELSDKVVIKSADYKLRDWLPACLSKPAREAA
jgi:hypothetical protein